MNSNHIKTLLASILVAGSTHAAMFERLDTDPLGTDTAFNAAWADFDGDGFVDVFTTNGRITLYRNNRDGTFTRITAGNALVEASVPSCFGSIWGDYNNDGFPDILVFTPGLDIPGNLLFRNDGNGSFTQILEGAVVEVVYPVPRDTRAHSAAWGDFNNDGWLDLFVGNWTRNTPARNFLYRNEGGDGFSLISDGVMGQVFPNPSSSQGTATGDFDNDGWLDIINLANAPSLPTNDRLYRNLGNFEFEMRHPFQGLTIEDDLDAVAVADFDNDGHLDILTALITFEGLNGVPHLWRNDGHGNFTLMRGDELFGSDVFGAVGIAWADYDNDGWLDVVMSRDADTSGENTNFLFRNNGDGTFTKVPDEPEITNNTANSQTGTWADINNDGFMDLLICNYNQSNVLMLNRGNDNHWLKLKLVGTESNADAIGAKVRVKATIQGEELWQLREVGTSQGWLTSQSDMRPNFGLGDATEADIVRIEWPSGIVQELTDAPSKRILTVIEPPRLRIDPDRVLSWPARAEGYQLESAGTAEGPWTEAPETVETDGTRKRVTIQPDGEARFYRLNRNEQPPSTTP